MRRPAHTTTLRRDRRAQNVTVPFRSVLEVPATSPSRLRGVGNVAIPQVNAAQVDSRGRRLVMGGSDSGESRMSIMLALAAILISLASVYIAYLAYLQGEQRLDDSNRTSDVTSVRAYHRPEDFLALVIENRGSQPALDVVANLNGTYYSVGSIEKCTRLLLVAPPPEPVTLPPTTSVAPGPSVPVPSATGQPGPGPLPLPPEGALPTVEGVPLFDGELYYNINGRLWFRDYSTSLPVEVDESQLPVGARSVDPQQEERIPNC